MNTGYFFGGGEKKFFLLLKFCSLSLKKKKVFDVLSLLIFLLVISLPTEMVLFPSQVRPVTRIAGDVFAAVAGHPTADRQACQGATQEQTSAA